MPSDTRFIRHESHLGAVDLAARRPHPALGADVLVLEDYEERTAKPVRQRHLPPTFVPLIINFGPPYLLIDPTDPRRVTERGSFLSGLGEAGGLTVSSGTARCVQVNLTPLGARRVFGVPMHELANREVALEAVLGQEASRLEERLAETPHWDTRLGLVESFLAARIQSARPIRPDVVRAWRRLEETGGRIRVEALARELRCSRKHLLAQFREHVGPGPKTVARLMRFNRLLRLLAREREPDWAGLAFRCGYSDQAHLSREVRRLAGCTPTELSERSPVTFVQDALTPTS